MHISYFRQFKYRTPIPFLKRIYLINIELKRQFWVDIKRFITFHTHCFELTYIFFYENITSLCLHRHRMSNVLNIAHVSTDKNTESYFGRKLKHKWTSFTLFFQQMVVEWTKPRVLVFMKTLYKTLQSYIYFRLTLREHAILFYLLLLIWWPRNGYGPLQIGMAPQSSTL